jgi:hypothetical protein
VAEPARFVRLDLCSRLGEWYVDPARVESVRADPHAKDEAAIVTMRTGEAQRVLGSAWDVQQRIQYGERC